MLLDIASCLFIPAICVLPRRRILAVLGLVSILIPCIITMVNSESYDPFGIYGLGTWAIVILAVLGLIYIITWFVLILTPGRFRNAIVIILVLSFVLFGVGMIPRIHFLIFVPAGLLSLITPLYLLNLGENH